MFVNLIVRKSCSAFVAAVLAIAPWTATAQTQSDPAAFRALMGRGIELHQRRDFDGAIQAYQQALVLQPENPMVFHELGFTLAAKGDCAGSIDAAQKGLNLRSSPAAQAQFHVFIGNCKDRLGAPEAALESYRKAIELEPKDYLVHFNMGITLARMQRLGPAREAIESAISIQPGHPSSHFVMSRLYEADGQNGPALLAVIQFLALEPTGQRAQGELSRIDRLFGKGVRADAAGKPSISIDPKTMQRDPTMAAVELGIALAESSFQATRGQSGSKQSELVVERLVKVIDMTGEMGAKAQMDTFAAKTYFPFFTGLNSRRYSRAFAWYALQSGNLPGMSEWVAANGEVSMQMVRWLREARRPITVPTQQ